jgi:DNA-binding NarL/FixJ family response regulator
MNGLETLDKVKEFNPETPVIMLSSQDKIEVAINCMHHKAFDYVVRVKLLLFVYKKIITSIFSIKKCKRIELVAWIACKTAILTYIIIIKMNYRQFGRKKPKC